MVSLLWVLALCGLPMQEGVAVPLQPSTTMQEPPLRFWTEVRRTGDGAALLEDAGLWLGEAIRVDLLLEVEPDFLERQVVPQWRAPLDLQFALRTPFALPSSEGGWTFHGAPLGGEARMVVDRELGGVQRLEDTEEGWRRYRWSRFVIVEGDRFQLPAAGLHLVWATRFEQDLVRGTVPLDRHETNLESQALDFPVSAIPVAAAPSGYRGAIGQFQMEVLLEPPTDAGAASGDGLLQLQVEVTGSGPLAAEHLPDWKDLPGFHVLGHRVEALDDGLRVFLELQAAPEVLAIPVPSWAYFDPQEPGQFKTLEEAPLPIPGRTPLGPTADSQGEEDAGDSKESLERFVPWVLGAAGLIGCFLLLRRSSRPVAADSDAAMREASTPSAGLAVRPKVAPKDSRGQSRAQAPQPRDLLDHIASFLSCPRAEVYAADLEGRLTAAGLQDSLAGDLDRAVQRILAARFGGSGALPSASEQQALADRLTSAC